MLQKWISNSSYGVFGIIRKYTSLTLPKFTQFKKNKNIGYLWTLWQRRRLITIRKIDSLKSTNRERKWCFK